jgi:cytochrome oxidase Cu insertion factor (SCO1/SenC/PrrC family)
MLIRWLATLIIAALLLLDLFIPSTSLGRRGTEQDTRREASQSVVRLGEPLPDLALLDLEGRPLDLNALRGHRVLLTFERSVDW